MKKEEIMGKKKGQMIVISIMFIVILLLLIRGCGLKKENEELILLNQMLQDKEELSCIYESGDFTSEEWLLKYREIGLRFMNYLCEYRVEKEEVKALIEKYQDYGEKIVQIANLIEEGRFEEAKQELEEVKTLANEIEGSLEAVYEEVR